MGFFDPLPPPPQFAEPEEEEWQSPPWLGPPGNVLGVPVASFLVLHRSTDLAIAVPGLVAFPTGLKFSLLVKTRKPRLLEPMGRMGPWQGHGRMAGATNDEVLRFGVLFADGGKATNHSREFGFEPDDEPQGPLLTEQGGGGGGYTWKQGYWLWPLPPPGQLVFVCQWTAAGVDETRVGIEMAPVIDAARDAVTLWDSPSSSGHGWASVRMLRSTPPDA
jgi:hypothetical protein